MPDMRARPWSYEEVVLACDLVAENSWHGLDRRRDPRVSALSQLLRRMSPDEAAASEKFRNVEGVGRKTQDIATRHPDYRGKPTRGGQIDRRVLVAFLKEPQRMHQLADDIRASIVRPEPASTETFDLDDSETWDEGDSSERRHLARERDPRARRRKIAHLRHAHGYVRCEACGFDFEATYGERGRDFIECHHRNPLSVVGPRITALADLALLCSNCHRMIHRYRPWIDVEQLVDLIRSSNGNLQNPRREEITT